MNLIESQFCPLRYKLIINSSKVCAVMLYSKEDVSKRLMALLQLFRQCIVFKQILGVTRVCTLDRMWRGKSREERNTRATAAPRQD